MNPGLCTIAFKDRPLADVVEIAARAGAESVELWGQQPHLPELGDLLAFERIRRQIRDAGLRLAAFGSYFRPGVERDPDGGLRASEPAAREASAGAVLEAAVRLQAPLIRIWAGRRNFADYNGDERAAVMRQIIEFANRAGEEEIRVVLERHSGTLTDAWDTTEQIVREIRGSVEAPDLVGLCYQVPYPVPAEELRTCTAADFATLMPLSLHVHLQNYTVPDTPPEDLHYPRTLLSEGIVDYAPLGSAVRGIGYQGDAMIEFIGPERAGMTEEEALKADLDFVKAL